MITATKVVDFKQISKLRCKPAAKVQLRYAMYLRSGVNNDYLLITESRWLLERLCAFFMSNPYLVMNAAAI